MKLSSIIPEKRVEPNDKLTKAMFNPEKDTTGKFNVREIKNKVTPVIFNTKLMDFTNYSAFDREVAMACYSFEAAAYKFVTTEQIYRLMIGDPKARLNVGTEMEKRICESLIKLVNGGLDIGTEGLQNIGYKVKKGRIVGSVVSGTFVEAEDAEGKRAGIKLSGESVLVELAKIKNGQLLTYQLNTIAMNGRVSPGKIVLMNYIHRRIIECDRHRNLKQRSISFVSLWKQNEIGEEARRSKSRYLKFVEEILDDFVRKGLIKSWERTRGGFKFEFPETLAEVLEKPKRNRTREKKLH